MSLLLFVAMPFSCIVWFTNGISQSNDIAYAKSVKSTEQYIISNLVSEMSTQYVLSFTPTSTGTPIPTATISPAPTVLASETSVPLVRLNFKLSFYDPAIGKIIPEIRYTNCFEWDDTLNDCVSRVNNGRDAYSLWYRRGVACPPPLALGQVIRVVSPSELLAINRDWVCIDRGGAIVGDFLDFMLSYPDDIWTGDALYNFPWQSLVVVELLP